MIPEGLGRSDSQSTAGSGATAKLPDLPVVPARDCPRVGAEPIYERCGVYYRNCSPSQGNRAETPARLMINQCGIRRLTRCKGSVPVDVAAPAVAAS